MSAKRLALFIYNRKDRKVSRTMLVCNFVRNFRKTTELYHGKPTQLDMVEYSYTHPHSNNVYHLAVPKTIWENLPPG